MNDLLDLSAEQHLDLFLRERGNQTMHYVVFHRDRKLNIPKNCYAVVKVEIISFDEVPQPIENVTHTAVLKYV